jgi:hypothetical protein
MHHAPPAVQALFADLIQGFERDNLKRERDAAQADPRKHRLSRTFDRGLSYHSLPAGRDGRGRWVTFCWSVHRNVAGYFLGWREVRGKRQAKRDRWVARRTRRGVIAIAQRRRDVFSAAQQPAEQSGGGQ